MSLYAGNGRKTPKYVQNENQGNNQHKYPHHISVQRIYEEWDIPITVHR